MIHLLQVILTWICTFGLLIGAGMLAVWFQERPRVKIYKKIVSDGSYMLNPNREPSELVTQQAFLNAKLICKVLVDSEIPDLQLGHCGTGVDILSENFLLNVTDTSIAGILKLEHYDVNGKNHIKFVVETTNKKWLKIVCDTVSLTKND